MSGVLENSVLFLYDLGFFTILLPFLLLYAIFFALLDKVKVISQREHNAILAFCFAFISVYNFSLIANLNELLIRLSLVFIVIVVLYILVGLLGMHDKLSSPLIIILFVLYFFYLVIDIFFSHIFLQLLSTLPFDVILPVIVSVFVFFGVMYYILSGGSSSSSNSSNNSSSSSSTSSSKPSSPQNTPNSKNSSSSSPTFPPLSERRTPAEVLSPYGNEIFSKK